MTRQVTWVDSDETPLILRANGEYLASTVKVTVRQARAGLRQPRKSHSSGEMALEMRVQRIETWAGTGTAVAEAEASLMPLQLRHSKTPFGRQSMATTFHNGRREALCTAGWLGMCLSFWFVAMTFAQSADEPSGADLTKWALSHVKATSSDGPQRVSVEYLHTASDSELEALEANANHGIALAAAWERVRRVLPRGTSGDKHDRSRDSISRFVGFFEGRLRVRVPKLWVNVLLTAKLTSQDRIIFDSPNVDLMSGHHEVAGMLMPHSTTVVDRADGLSLRVGEQEARLSSKFVEAIDPWNATIAQPVFANDTCIIAIYTFVGLPYPLHCLRVEDGSVQWMRRVLAANRFVYYQGPGWFHRAWLLATESTVIVLGIARDAAYVEQYSLVDGEVRFRFSTSYD